MAELVPLSTYRHQCQKSVVEILEAALEEARAGNIVAVSIAVVRPDGAMNASRSETDDTPRLLAAMVLAQARFLRKIDEP